MNHHPGAPTKTPELYRYVNPNGLLHYDLDYLAVGDLLGGNLPEAFMVGDNVYYRLTVAFYCYLRVVLLGMKKSFERGAVVRSVLAKALTRYRAHHDLAVKEWGLDTLVIASGAFDPKGYLLPTPAGDWSKKLGKPSDAAATTEEASTKTQAPPTPTPSVTQSPVQATPAPLSGPAPVELPPDGPEAKQRRFELCKVALSQVAAIYPPGCLLWAKEYHPDALEAVKQAEKLLEGEVAGGSLDSTILASNAYVNAWRKVFALWDNSHELERCEGCDIQGLGITTKTTSGKRLCPWCIAKLTGVGPDTPSTLQSALALEALVK